MDWQKYIDVDDYQVPDAGSDQAQGSFSVDDSSIQQNDSFNLPLEESKVNLDSESEQESEASGSSGSQEDAENADLDFGDQAPQDPDLLTQQQATLA